MDIVIIGVGEFSKVIEELILENEENNIVGYLDDRYIYVDFRDNQFTGPITVADRIINFYNDLKFVIGIKNNAVRKSIVQKLGLTDKNYVTLCSKSAVISPSALIKPGTVIMAGAIVNSNVNIGRHSMIGSGAVIEYDNELGDFVYISTNATLTESVNVGEGANVGSGVVIDPNTVIKEWSDIGTMVVTDDVSSRSTMVGTHLQS